MEKGSNGLTAFLLSSKSLMSAFPPCPSYVFLRLLINSFESYCSYLNLLMLTKPLKGCLKKSAVEPITIILWTMYTMALIASTIYFLHPKSLSKKQLYTPKIKVIFDNMQIINPNISRHRLKVFLLMRYDESTIFNIIVHLIHKRSKQKIMILLPRKIKQTVPNMIFTAAIASD